MGVDIHMYLAREGEEIKLIMKDFGRNSEWFANLQGDGYDNEYDRLPRNYGFSPFVDEKFKDKYTKQSGYYGFIYMTVQDFKYWYYTFRPDKKAGWVTRYEAWAYKNHKISAYDLEPFKYCDPHRPPQDQIFLEYEDEYEPSKKVIEELESLGADYSDHIGFFFDC